jgi:hypothetical protein
MANVGLFSFVTIAAWFFAWAGDHRLAQRLSKGRVYTDARHTNTKERWLPRSYAVRQTECCAPDLIRASSGLTGSFGSSGQGILAGFHSSY